MHSQGQTSAAVPASKARAWHRRIQAQLKPTDASVSCWPACTAHSTVSTLCRAAIGWHSTRPACSPQAAARCRAQRAAAWNAHTSRLQLTLCRAAAQELGPGPQALDVDRLINLLERLGDSGQAPDQEWVDMMFGVTSSPAHQLNATQRLRLMVAVASLGLPAEHDWIQNIAQVEVAAASAPQLLMLWGAMYALGHQPERDWLWAGMQQVANLAEQLDADAAAQAVCLSVELGILVDPVAGEAAQGGQQGQGELSEQFRQQLGLWLDTLCIRMAECDMRDLNPDLLADTCVAVCSSCRHLPPREWVDQLSQAALRPDLPPAHISQIAVSLAACRGMPDLVLPPQMYLITAGCLDDLASPLVTDVIWAVATWHVGSEGGELGRYDLRPPARWWAEWFQASGQQLQQGALPREVLLRVLWSLAVLRVRPPEAWTKMLVAALQAALVAGSFTPLELLYLTRSSDMWYGMLTGVDQAGSRAALPGVTPLRTLRVAGVEEPYEPPVQLAVLVRDAARVMGQTVMPPGWRRINTRFPPYSLPARADEGREDASPQDDVDGDVLSRQGVQDAPVPWRETLAAKGIYGPLTRPDWR